MLQTLTGWDSPQTLRINTSVPRKHLNALIDSGATHNFISENVAHLLYLKLTNVQPFNVKVANGHPYDVLERNETSR